MDPILAITRKYNLKVIEDSAQCLGGQYKGKPVGTIGDVSTFSFCQSKHFTQKSRHRLNQSIIVMLCVRRFALYYPEQSACICILVGAKSILFIVRIS